MNIVDQYQALICSSSKDSLRAASSGGEGNKKPKKEKGLVASKEWQILKPMNIGEQVLKRR